MDRRTAVALGRTIPQSVLTRADEVIQSSKAPHYVSLYWDYGAWSATLTDNFQKGTYDAPPTTNPLNGTTQRKIGDYDLWNMSASYTGFKNWTLSARIKNIFDRDPPLSIQIATSANAGQVGYDPTYTDPHGRLF